MRWRPTGLSNPRIADPAPDAPTMVGEAAVDSPSPQAVLAHLRHELRTPINAIIGYSEMLLEDLDLDDQNPDDPKSDSTTATLHADPYLTEVSPSPETRPESPSLTRDLRQILTAGRQLLALVNQTLDPARIQAAEVNAAVFGAELRHQIHTPLNHIIGFSAMLIDDARTTGAPDLLADLEKIHRAGLALAERMDELIQTIEEAQILSTPEKPRPGWPPAETAPAPRTEDVRSSFSPGMHSAGAPSDIFPESPNAVPGLLLVVDDNESNRDLLSRHLERQGHQVIVAESGRAALEKIAETEFDLVLLDVMMPEMDGYEVLQRIKLDEALRHIPVIMISALDELDSVVRCIALGAEDYLPKPFNPVFLKARIGACLEKKRLRDREVLYLRQIEEEKRRSDELLHVIFPTEIVHELKTNRVVVPRRCENVAVLFCDIVGFTRYCGKHEPEEVITYLQELFEVFEGLSTYYKMEKIKTVGDSYMAAAGLLQWAENPAMDAVKCGLRMVRASRRLRARWEVRVGINVGPAVAGVVGRRKYLFDLWGDTVNTAARVESSGRDGAVNVSRVAWDTVQEFCDGESLGIVQAKGKETLEVIRVSGLKQPEILFPSAPRPLISSDGSGANGH